MLVETDVNDMAHGKFVAYYRVSTQKQGRSGLGLDAQKEAVRTFLSGGNWTLVAEVVEVESGKKDDRPKLTEALRLCRLHGARLLIAKLDRLSRDAYFLLGLQKSGVQFTAADMPEANEMVVGIMAVVAQAERKMISARTKAALAAAKARGTVLGGHRGVTPSREDQEAGRAVQAARALSRVTDLAPVIRDIQASGATSLAAVARVLNERGIPAARGGEWSPMQVSRVMAHLSSVG